MKEWYLMTENTRPNSIGGFENMAFNDYKQDAFAESLTTDVASNVILYNHDLSIGVPMRCIIQGNAPNTQLSSMERIGLFPVGTVKAGMYVFYDDCYWIIHGFPSNNKIYEKAPMILCQYQLRWQKDNGDIVERWANFVSASKYDTGNTQTPTLILGSNNFTIMIPDDDDSATLDDKRVFIDRNKIKPTKVYHIARSDDVLYLYGDKHGGVLSFIADKSEINYNTDRQDLRICDYHSPTLFNPKPPVELFVSIAGGSTLRYGRAKTWFANFKDENGDKLDKCEATWNIVADFEIEQSSVDNKIRLKVLNESDIGKSFKLQAIIDNKVMAETEISVIDML